MTPNQENLKAEAESAITNVRIFSAHLLAMPKFRRVNNLCAEIESILQEVTIEDCTPVSNRIPTTK